ncbi:MAG: anaerobic ribonucleoside-triphosphate reductase activating protein [Clostridiales bacterium]|jgi:pyruvate formate lyase activating enzyme|nr:anaerobic ribonucleoside-triphosphate reductase activating protein [Clostridiales bacterium]
MKISGIVKSSLIDYPGNVACVLFAPGCNFNCFYCHNRRLIEGSENIISPGYIQDFLKKRTGFLDAVVISGGEPTLQPDLSEYIRSIKAMGYKVKLDTNGSSPETVKKLLDEKLCDYYAVDYKAPAKRYEEICGPGADAGRVLKTINLLLSRNADFQVRTTVIPQLQAEDLFSMAKELPVVPGYVLNPYRKPDEYLPRDEDRVSKKPYSGTELKYLCKKVTTFQPNALCAGH